MDLAHVNVRRVYCPWPDVEEIIPSPCRTHVLVRAPYHLGVVDMRTLSSSHHRTTTTNNNNDNNACTRHRPGASMMRVLPSPHRRLTSACWMSHTHLYTHACTEHAPSQSITALHHATAPHTRLSWALGDAASMVTVHRSRDEAAHDVNTSAAADCVTTFWVGQAGEDYTDETRVSSSAAMTGCGRVASSVGRASRRHTGVHAHGMSNAWVHEESHDKNDDDNNCNSSRSFVRDSVPTCTAAAAAAAERCDAAVAVKDMHSAVQAALRRRRRARQNAVRVILPADEEGRHLICQRERDGAANEGGVAWLLSVERGCAIAPYTLRVLPPPTSSSSSQSQPTTTAMHTWNSTSLLSSSSRAAYEAEQRRSRNDERMRTCTKSNSPSDLQYNSAHTHVDAACKSYASHPSHHIRVAAQHDTPPHENSFLRLFDIRRLSSSSCASSSVCVETLDDAVGESRTAATRVAAWSHVPSCQFAAVYSRWWTVHAAASMMPMYSFAFPNAHAHTGSARLCRATVCSGWRVQSIWQGNDCHVWTRVPRGPRNGVCFTEEDAEESAFIRSEQCGTFSSHHYLLTVEEEEEEGAACETVTMRYANAHESTIQSHQSVAPDNNSRDGYTFMCATHEGNASGGMNRHEELCSHDKNHRDNEEEEGECISQRNDKCDHTGVSKVQYTPTAHARHGTPYSNTTHHDTEESTACASFCNNWAPVCWTGCFDRRMPHMPLWWEPLPPGPVQRASRSSHPNTLDPKDIYSAHTQRAKVCKAAVWQTPSCVMEALDEGKGMAWVPLCAPRHVNGTDDESNVLHTMRVSEGGLLAPTVHTLSVPPSAKPSRLCEPSVLGEDGVVRGAVCYDKEMYLFSSPSS